MLGRYKATGWGHSKSHALYPFTTHDALLRTLHVILKALPLQAGQRESAIFSATCLPTMPVKHVRLPDVWHSSCNC